MCNAAGMKDEVNGMLRQNPRKLIKRAKKENEVLYITMALLPNQQVMSSCWVLGRQREKKKICSLHSHYPIISPSLSSLYQSSSVSLPFHPRPPPPLSRSAICCGEAYDGGILPSSPSVSVHFQYRVLYAEPASISKQI